MTVKDKIKLTIRGYKTFHSLIPGYLLTMGIQSVFSSLLPFINIFMSAKIINALTNYENLRKILFLVILTVTLNMITTLISSGIWRLRSYYEVKFWQLEDQPVNEKIMQMDYERVEDTNVHLKREYIRTLRQTNGFGLPRLIWCYSGILQSIFKLLFSVSLLSGAFTTFHAKDAGIWSFLFSPLSILIIIIFIAISITVNIFSTKKSMKKLTDIISGFHQVNRMGHYYMNYLLNYKAGKDLKLYALNKPIAKEFGGVNDLCIDLMSKLQKSMAKYDSFIAASNTVLTGIIYAYVAIKALFGSFGVGNIVQYVGCLSQLSSGVTGIMENITLLNVNTEALALFFEFTDMADVKYHGTIPVEKRNDNEFEIEFHNVSFKYPGTDTYALKNLNMKLQIGQRMAVVGMNGSGKTTMIKLLCRLYDPTEGEITLNGIDIKKYDYNEYISIFSVVFQDFKLFSFSLGQNVATSVEYDSKKVANALKKAGFADRLASMSKGLDTSLYKDFEDVGVEISGGEAQKIALARALYKDTPFIVLDEPTAALDPISEFEIYSKFNEIVDHKTTIYISHRLSSCWFCDDIAVFHEGQLIQRGNHNTLISNVSGKYYELWNAQAQYYNENIA